jgi:plastocyanin
MRKRILASLLVALALSAVALLLPSNQALAGGTCHKGQPVTEQTSNIVTMSNNCFIATITRVDEGAKVTFLNEDEAAHAVTGANYSWGMGSDEGQTQEELFNGESFKQTFADSGVYPYFCFLHPGMIGAVVVGDGTNTAAVSPGEAQGESFASTAPQRDASAEPQAVEASASDDSPGTPVIVALVAAGVVLLGALVVAARTLSMRRARGG